MATAEDQKRTKDQAHVNTTIEEEMYQRLGHIPLHTPVTDVTGTRPGGWAGNWLEEEEEEEEVRFL
jgi:hypothetical protein